MLKPFWNDLEYLKMKEMERDLRASIDEIRVKLGEISVDIDYLYALWCVSVEQLEEEDQEVFLKDYVGYIDDFLALQKWINTMA